MNKRLLGSALALSLTALAHEARGQAVEVSRPRAFVLNAGPMIGILGGGIYGRINLEFQVHLGRRFEGHSFNIGASVVPWPNEGGPSVSLSPRYQYDHQLVPGTPFFVSPYVGFDAGLGIFNIFDGGMVRYRAVFSPMAGLDLKAVVAGRLLLGFRPIGITVPLFIGGPVVTADVIYDIAFTVGVTF